MLQRLRKNIATIMLAMLLSSFAGGAMAGSTFSGLPAASQPLGSNLSTGSTGQTYMPLDQGTDCTAAAPANCKTVQTDALRVGQPIQIQCSLVGTGGTPGPFQYQFCIDTSFNPPVLKEYIGSTWWPFWSLSPSTGPSFVPSQPYVTALGSQNVSGSGAQTTGNTTGSNTITLNAANGFANGMGIRVNAVGPNPSLAPASGCTISNVGTPGSTHYQYTVAAFDAAGGVTAPVTCTTTTGAATLNTTNYNSITITPGAGTPAGYAIWGDTAGSPTIYAMFSQAITTYFDQGQSGVVAPDWLPQTPPTGTIPDWVVSTVSTGGGSTGLTIAGTFTVTGASGVTVVHDDTAALQSAINGLSGRPFFWNAGTYMISSALSITSATCMFGAGRQLAFVTLSSPTQDGFDFSTSDKDCIYDIAIIGNDGSGMYQAGGAMIKQSTGHTGNAYENLVATWAYDVISDNNIGAFDYDNLIINGAHTMFSGLNESDGVFQASFINPVSIPGASGANAASGMQLSGDPGGTRVIGNKFNGTYTAAIDADISVSDGDFFVIGNSIEGWNLFGVLFQPANNSVTFGSVIISGNETNGQGVAVEVQGNLANTQWFSNLIVSNNILGSGGVSSEGVAVDGTTTAIISNTSIASAATGILIGAHVGNCQISMMNYTSVSTQITDSSHLCNGTTLLGTQTNNSAAAGYLGEYVSSTNSSVSLSNGVGAAICSVSLTAGDWDVRGGVTFIPAGGTTTTAWGVGSNTTAGAIAASLDPSIQAIDGQNISGAQNQNMTVGSKRYLLSGTTTVYLNASAAFSGSTMTASCAEEARRVR